MDDVEREPIVAVCIQCGSFKPGPFSACDACGYIPEGVDARTKSALLSGIYLPANTLEEFAVRMRAGESLSFDPDVLIAAQKELGPMLVGVASLPPPLDRSCLSFPHVEGFSLTGPTHYPNPAHGYAVRYVSDIGAHVSVTVYNTSPDPIPDGGSSPIVREEVSLIEEALMRFCEVGDYRSFKEVRRGATPIGDFEDAPVAQHRTYEIDRTDTGWIETKLLITGHWGQFFKVRASYPLHDSRRCRGQVAKVLNALGEMLVRSRASSMDDKPA